MKDLVFKGNEGAPVTSSLLVAQKFGKLHKNVLQAIKNLLDDINELPENEHRLNFKLMQQIVETDNGGWREAPYYIMNRDGFMLLAMGFTGREALRFKVVFIDAFNRMEKELQGRLFAREGEASLIEDYVERCVERRLAAMTPLPERVSRTGAKHPVPPVKELDVRADADAYRFYSEYRTSEGTCLDSLTVMEYCGGACVLNAIGDLLKKTYGTRKYSKRYNRALFWQQVAKLIQGVDFTRFPHQLPENPRRLQRRHEKYLKEGYKSLIHGGFDNHNAKKIKQK